MSHIIWPYGAHGDIHLKNFWSPDRAILPGSSQLQRKARYFLVPCLGSSLPLSASADPSARPVSPVGRQRRILPVGSCCPHCRYLFLFAQDLFLWLNPHGLERKGQPFQLRHNHPLFPQILPTVSGRNSTRDGRMVLGRDFEGADDHCRRHFLVVSYSFFSWGPPRSLFQEISLAPQLSAPV